MLKIYLYIVASAFITVPWFGFLLPGLISGSTVAALSGIAATFLIILPANYYIGREVYNYVKAKFPS